MNRHSLVQQKLFSKRFGVFLLIQMLGMNLTITSSEAASCDVIAQATVKIQSIKTTTTSAAIKWTERHSNDKRYFCYGTTLPGTCNTPVANRSSHLTNVSGLTANTKYFYMFYGVGHGKKTTTTGSFMADGSECTSTSTKVDLTGTILSATGDSLEHVVASLSKSVGGTPLFVDTTNRSGFYGFEVDPGAYFISFTRPPFTSPTPYSATVLTGKDLVVPTQKMTGAFQAGGTVINIGKDSISGAIVTAVSTSDPTINYRTETDDDGHYNFGMKAGSYTLIAKSKVAQSAAPTTITITDKDLTIPVITLSIPVSIRPGIRKNGKFSGTIPHVDAYQINGTSLDQKQRPMQGMEVYRHAR